MSYDGSLRFDTSLDANGINSGLQKMNGMLKSRVKTAVTAVAAAATALTGYAIKVGSDFEAGMSKVEAISGATGADLEALTEKAKEMGAKTKFSATEAASAMEYMAMAGWKTGDMLSGIDGIMNLAAASGTDLATTSDIVTDALTAFGLSAKDSTHFADVLAAASSNANTNVAMLGESFKYVGPIAGSFGYTVEDVSLALGLMANAGIKSEQAGTSLRGMLTRMQKDSGAASDSMKELGISMFNSNGSARRLEDVLRDLRTSTANLTAEEKARHATAIAGMNAQSGFLALLNATDEEFDSLSASIANADGTAENMARTMNDNLRGSVTIFKSALEGLGITIYEKLKEPLRDAVDSGIDYLNRLNSAFKSGGFEGLIEEAGAIFGRIARQAQKAAPEMVKAAGSLVKTFASTLASLLPASVRKPVQDAVNEIAKSFTSGGLKSAVNTFTNMFKNLTTVIGSVAKVALPLLTGAVDLLGKSMKVTLPIVTALVVALKTMAIVQSIQKTISVTTAAMAAFTAAQAAGTTATAASTAALTLKNVALGVLTRSISLAEARQCKHRKACGR